MNRDIHLRDIMDQRKERSSKLESKIAERRKAWQAPQIDELAVHMTLGGDFGIDDAGGQGSPS
jgi:hypothetical protein